MKGREGKDTQKTWIRVLTTVITVSIMAMIFFFSTEQAEQSDATSGFFSLWVLRLTHPGFESLPEEERVELYNRMQTVIRKIAHFTEFALLGFSIRLCLESWFGGRRKCLGAAACIGGAAYAGLDEWHQTLVDGRSGQWADVGIDTSGVLTGVLIATWILNRYIRKKKTDTSGSGSGFRRGKCHIHFPARINK